MAMIDTGEAVRSLDIYSDELASLALLVRVSTLQDKTDEEICEIYEGLKNAIEEKQKEAITLAYDIVATKDRRGGDSDSSAAAFGVSAAIRRCVIAIGQATEALKPPRETFVDAIFRKEREKVAKEQEAKEANLVSQRAVNPAKASTATMAGEPLP